MAYHCDHLLFFLKINMWQEFRNMTRHLTTENGVEWNLNKSNLVKNKVGGIFLMVSVES